MSSLWPSNDDLARLAQRPAVIDLRTLHTRIAEDPDDRALSLLIWDADDEALAELVSGVSADAPGERAAIAGLEALAEMVLRLAALLRIRAGDRRVLEAFAYPDVPAQVTPPMNAGGM